MRLKVIAKTSPWDLENRSEKPEEIIYMVKKGGNAPMRPTLTLGENMDINPAMVGSSRIQRNDSPSRS